MGISYLKIRGYVSLEYYQALTDLVSEHDFIAEVKLKDQASFSSFFVRSSCMVYNFYRLTIKPARREEKMVYIGMPIFC